MNYALMTPNRRKNKQLCHINMLKPYVNRDDSEIVSPISTIVTSSLEENEDFEIPSGTLQSQNSNILKNIDSKLTHLSHRYQAELKKVLCSYQSLFPDIPRRTNRIFMMLMLEMPSQLNSTHIH